MNLCMCVCCVCIINIYYLVPLLVCYFYPKFRFHLASHFLLLQISGNLLFPFVFHPIPTAEPFNESRFP